MAEPVGPADVFALAGCPVCQVSPRIEAGLVDGFFRRGSDGPSGRARVLAIGGLCARHWRLVAAAERARSEEGDMVGTARLLADVLDRFGKHGAVARCPLCVETARSARDWFCGVLDDLGPARQAQAPPPWRPCLPHLEACAGCGWSPGWHAGRNSGRTVRWPRRSRPRATTCAPRASPPGGAGRRGEELLAAVAALLGDLDQVPVGASP